ncbi:hypothetical protein J3A84_09040 [Proteiniclasticum sp. SCR006]|uniref:Cobalamin adenosyltransferase-like domain-containing protein n=1 Tax=Proteiniclasticum aestuarii TaxID=2817862 RepID=A0A939KL03_9CLOT|nr:hypothetical protein [Proteiniclasticum aestuarii]MBO1265170.1 hypothetical protein [Proteiniclasticum aestuarii]
MAVLTESLLRSKWKNEKFTEYVARKNEVITPSAREFLKEKGVELKFGEAASSDEDRKHVHRVPHPVREREATSNVSDDPKRYKNYYTDEYYSKKPEFMTQIRADLLVFKDDPRIIFRGRIDSLEAEMLRGMLLMRHEKNADLFKGLKDIYLHLRKIMRAEVLGEPIKSFSVLGKDYEEIRKITHSPSDHFPGGHLVMTGEEKPAVIHLNVLRAAVREVEIVGVTAFKNGTEVERNDIIESLNRLSSALYYLMMIAHYGNGQ